MSVNTGRYVFAADKVGDWANRVLKFVNGESASIESLSKRVDTQMQRMADPEVWSGGAAVKNFRDMFDTYLLLVKFANTFATNFSENMKAIEQNAIAIEEANLAENVTIADKFGTITVNGIEAPVTAAISTERDVYDKETIRDVVREFNSIMGELGQIESVLRSRIEELDGQNGWFEGKVANNLQQSLLETLNQYCTPIVKNLQMCVDNMAQRLANVENADQ